MLAAELYLLANQSQPLGHSIIKPDDDESFIRLAARSVWYGKQSSCKSLPALLGLLRPCLSSGSEPTELCCYRIYDSLLRPLIYLSAPVVSVPRAGRPAGRPFGAGGQLRELLHIIMPSGQRRRRRRIVVPLKSFYLCPAAITSPPSSSFASPANQPASHSNNSTIASGVGRPAQK